MDSDEVTRINRAVGRRIYECRTASGLTQADVAVALNCKRANIGHIEAGRQSATFVQLCAIAGLLGVPVNQLYAPAARTHGESAAG